MSGIRIILCGMLAMLVAGCGQIVTETVSVQQTVPSSSCTVNRKIVILPFADYSYADDMQMAFMRNMAVMEALTDQLVARGFSVPVQEDTLRYLVSNDIIETVDPGAVANSSSVRDELQSNWSDVMKEELHGLIDIQQRMAQASQGSKAPGVHGLDSVMVAKIGQDFDARFVVRGRIISYGLEKENNWSPMKKGFLPFVFDGSNQLLFGFASSDTYDTLSSMAIGYGVGALAGDSATNPYSFADKADPSGSNSAVWGAAGAGVAYLAEQGGDTSQAVVQLRIWIQDTESGDVIWTNRVKVNVAPQTVFADNTPGQLVNTAVNRAVSALMADFWTKNELYL